MTSNHHMAQELSERVAEFIEEHKLFGASERLILGVSGGRDSMTLLHLLLSMGYEFGVAHMNYQLRGDDSEIDAAFVKSFCERHDITFHLKSIETKKLTQESGKGTQEFARDARYAWFEELCIEYGYDKVVVAHHLDDSVETIIFNQLRGTGLKGLLGIPVTRGSIVRPMLCLWRKDVDTLVHALGVEFREDASNASNDYTRNAIRNIVVPALSEVKPNASATLIANADRLRQVQNGLEKMTAHLAKSVSKVTATGVEIDRPALKALPAPEMILMYIARQYGFSEQQVSDMYASDAHSGPHVQSASHVMFVHRDKVLIDSISARIEIDVEIAIPGETNIGSGAILVEKVPRPDRFDPSSDAEYFDITRLNFPLRIRNWQNGDRLSPLGMNGTKKVSDILTDQKLSYLERRNQLVVLSGDEVLWVVGRKVSRLASVDNHTRTCLRLTWQTD